MQSAHFCLKMSSKRRVHAVGGRGAAQRPDNCKGTVTRDSKWYEVRKGGYTVRESLGKFKTCGRLGPAVFKGQSHGIERWGGVQRPVLREDELKKTGAHSGRTGACRAKARQL
jgi:hypothetical protein